MKTSTMDFPKTIIGTMRWSDDRSVNDWSRLIEFCAEVDYHCFDLADIYGGHSVEGLFGKALKKSNVKREEIQLISKCGILYPSENRNYRVKAYDLSKKHILQSVENSLKELKTDYLDVLLIHRPSPIMNFYEIAKTAELLKQKGKIKEFGVSNFSTQEFEQLNELIPLVTNQIEVSITHLNAFYNHTLHQLVKYNKIPLAWSVLGSYFSEDSERKNQIQRKTKLLTEKYNATESQILIAFLRKHPSNIIPIIGTTNQKRIQEIKQSESLQLDDEDWFILLEASNGKKVP